MTNYTIELLKREEVRLGDCIDILNSAATGTLEYESDRKSLVEARSNIREAIIKLESKESHSVSSSDLNKNKWQKADEEYLEKARNIIDEKWSEIKQGIQKEKDDKDTVVFNSDSKSVEFRGNVKIRTADDAKTDIALSLLKKMNEEGKTVTRLHLVNGCYVTVVEDFSPFCNVEYMSKDLLDAIKNKRTLTRKQEEELETFINDVVVEL